MRLSKWIVRFLCYSANILLYQRICLKKLLLIFSYALLKIKLTRYLMVYQLFKPSEMMEKQWVFLRCFSNEEKQFPCSFAVKQSFTRNAASSLIKLNNFSIMTRCSISSMFNLLKKKRYHQCDYIVIRVIYYINKG